MKARKDGLRKSPSNRTSLGLKHVQGTSLTLNYQTSNRTSLGLKLDFTGIVAFEDVDETLLIEPVWD